MGTGVRCHYRARGTRYRLSGQNPHFSAPRFRGVLLDLCSSPYSMDPREPPRDGGGGLCLLLKPWLSPGSARNTDYCTKTKKSMCIWAKQRFLRPQALTQRSKGGQRWPWKQKAPVGRFVGGRQADRLILCTFGPLLGGCLVQEKAWQETGKGFGQGRPCPIWSWVPLYRC